MNHSEEETFEALLRDSFEEMIKLFTRKAIRDCSPEQLIATGTSLPTLLRSSNQPSWANVPASSGWTNESLADEIEKRIVPLLPALQQQVLMEKAIEERKRLEQVKSDQEWWDKNFPNDPRKLIDMQGRKFIA